MNPKYVHTNLIADDWKKLSQFYQSVFACVPVPPERDFAGPDLVRATNVADASLCGVHLRLPGHGPDGPTLEIFQYGVNLPGQSPASNRPGYGHIAFTVDDVTAACKEVLSAGGAAFGDVVTLTTSDNSRVTWCYVADVEGNLIELQSWSSE